MQEGNQPVVTVLEEDGNQFNTDCFLQIFEVSRLQGAGMCLRTKLLFVLLPQNMLLYAYVVLCYFAPNHAL